MKRTTKNTCKKVIYSQYFLLKELKKMKIYKEGIFKTVIYVRESSILLTYIIFNHVETFCNIVVQS